MRIQYFGHSAFAFISSEGCVLVDPFISGSPHMKGKRLPEDLNVTSIILTHGHGDHVGDAVQLAKKHSAVIVAIPELAALMGQKGAQVKACALGGPVEFPWGNMRFVQAVHSSAYENKYAGVAAGIILQMEGHTLYHAGDTALFGDMALIGRLYRPEIALLPIGGYFTMDKAEALEAAKMLQAQTVIPMHYNTFPVIQADPEEYKQAVEKETASKVKIMQPLDAFEI